MQLKTPRYILTIAGFDPSGGAGVTADIKTFQAHGLYGLAVCTAVTIQNDIDFRASHWVDTNVILQQLEVLLSRFDLDVIKIGIVKDETVLTTILDKLHALKATVRIVLDPILKASAGFEFRSQITPKALDTILKKVFVVTPNYEEIQKLYPKMSVEETINHICNITNLYLKGGHRTSNVGQDVLFYDTTNQRNIEPQKIPMFPKHGSGCVLSSAIASHLALEKPIESAAVLAKRYVEAFLSSTSHLLGYHTTIP